MKILSTIILVLILIGGGTYLVYKYVLKKEINKEELKYQFEEFKKSRALLGTLSIFLGLIIAFAISPMFFNTINKKVSVLEITKDIKIGEKLTDNMFREVELIGYNLSSNIVKDRSEIKNKYAVSDLIKGHYLYNDNMSEMLPYENEYLYKSVTGANRAISFDIKNMENGLANKIKQGDIISIVVINSNAKTVEEQTYIPSELKYVEVLSTTNEEGADLEDSEDSSKSNENIYSTITVLVSPEQAELIANADATKEIYVELVYRQGNAKVAKYLLNKQNDILNELYEERECLEDSKNIKKILDDENKGNYMSGSESLKEINKELENILNGNFDSNNDNDIDLDNEKESEAEETIEETSESIEETSKKETNEETKKEVDNVKETIVETEKAKTQKEIEIEEYNRIKKELGV